MTSRHLFSILLGTALFAGCSREVRLEFVKGEDGVSRVSGEQLDAWAGKLASSDDKTAEAMLDEAYSVADSISLREDYPRTLEVFASEVADRFLAVGSPLYDEHV